MASVVAETAGDRESTSATAVVMSNFAGFICILLDVVAAIAAALFMRH
jgi:hypothetical protein